MHRVYPFPTPENKALHPHQDTTVNAMSKRLSAVALRRISRKDQNILNAAQKASVECVKYERTEIALGNKKNTVGREYTRPTVNKCFLLSSVSAWG